MVINVVFVFIVINPDVLVPGWEAMEASPTKRPIHHNMEAEAEAGVNTLPKNMPFICKPKLPKCLSNANIFGFIK